MSITREKGTQEIIFHCDHSRCPEIMESETSNFQEALDALKAQRWTFLKISGDWEHYCPSCSEEM